MKFLIVMMMSVFAVSAFAGDAVSEAISNIQSERNVACEYVNKGFAVCLGSPREFTTCRYTQTFKCSGAEEFTVKLKVKESYNRHSGARETAVTNIQYL